MRFITKIFVVNSQESAMINGKIRIFGSNITDRQGSWTAMIIQARIFLGILDTVLGDLRYVQHADVMKVMKL